VSPKPDISFLAVPIRNHTFFKQAQFQGLLGDDFLQRPGFLSQIPDLAAGRRTCGIAGQSSLASFQELFRPVVVEALGNALAPTQLRDAVLTAKAVQHNTDLLLGRVLLARGSPNVLHDPLGRWLLALGFLSHLHSLMVTMSQKSSLIQPANSVSQALIPDNLPSILAKPAVRVFRCYGCENVVSETRPPQLAAS